MIKTEILKFVASSAGIKLGKNDKWINPATSEIKADVISKLNQLKSLEGKEVQVEFDDDGKYLAIMGTGNEVKEEVKDVVSNYTIKLQGKEFITHEGLLKVAHAKGLKRIETEMLENTKELVVFKAVVTMKDESVFEGHGDCTPTNVNSNIRPHMIRMAETRAVNRALRFATEIGMCSIDELGGKEEVPPVEERGDLYEDDIEELMNDPEIKNSFAGVSLKED